MSKWIGRWRALLRHQTGRAGLLIVVGMIGVGLAAPLIAPYDPLELVATPLEVPSAQHWLGTDSLGRDVLSRVIYGARTSIAAAAVSVSVALAAGVSAGAVAGYFGGWIDTLIMRGIDVLLSFPGILVALLVVVALEPGWPSVMIAVGLINVPLFCRQARAAVLSIRHHDYVEAAIAAGADTGYVLTRAIMPNLVPRMIVLTTLALGTAIIEVAGLSFLGLSGEVDVAEWGTMLTVAKSHLRVSIWPALAPGLAISVTVLGFNILGDAMRDLLDPRSEVRI
ncbi:MAG: ABC transporter permease [Planctomycetales bacterium]|nr:ABC transporter permease [Planctomycetales bacterium]